MLTLIIIISHLNDRYFMQGKYQQANQQDKTKHTLLAAAMMNSILLSWLSRGRQELITSTAIQY